MMELLEGLSGGFVVLVIASLFLISIGFLADSIAPANDDEEPKQHSRPVRAVLAVGLLVLVGFWISNLTELLAEAERDWFMLAMCVFWIGFGLIEAFKHAKGALLGDRAVDIQQ